MATNEKIDNFLKRIQDRGTRDRIINKMKSLVNSNLETTNPNYDTVMQEINLKVKKIEEVQLEHFEDKSIILESPEGLKSKQQYSYTVEDIMVNKRADIDFFEFISIKRSDLLGVNDEYIDVTPDLITGVAPIAEGLYTYNVTLKYTNFAGDNKQKAIDTQFKLWVGEKPKESNMDAPIHTMLYVVIAILILIFVSMIFLQIYVQCYKAKTFKFQDIANASQYMDSGRDGIQYELGKSDTKC